MKNFFYLNNSRTKITGFETYGSQRVLAVLAVLQILKRARLDRSTAGPESRLHQSTSPCMHHKCSSPQCSTNVDSAPRYWRGDTPSCWDHQTRRFTTALLSHPRVPPAAPLLFLIARTAAARWPTRSALLTRRTTRCASR